MNFNVLIITDAPWDIGFCVDVSPSYETIIGTSAILNPFY